MEGILEEADMVDGSLRADWHFHSFRETNFPQGKMKVKPRETPGMDRCQSRQMLGCNDQKVGNSVSLTFSLFYLPPRSQSRPSLPGSGTPVPALVMTWSLPIWALNLGSRRRAAKSIAVDGNDLELCGFKPKTKRWTFRWMCEWRKLLVWSFWQHGGLYRKARNFQELHSLADTYKWRLIL